MERPNGKPIPTSERIVDEGDVADLLGLRPVRPPRAPSVAVNVGMLNALGQRWANTTDLERAFRLWARKTDGHTSRLLNDIADLMAGGKD